MKTVSTAIALSVLGSMAQADAAGLKVTEWDMPHHEAETRVAIWYPTVDAGHPTLYADNPVFQGVDAQLDAPIAAGAFPVVMFSHGMGGTDRAQAWLGAGMAERGAIVVVVNHLGSTWGDFDMSRGVRHWTRAADMSAALTALQEDPAFSQSIDGSRIMAAGFSFGGWTALSLGGATGNLGGTVGACENNLDQMDACKMLLSDRVNMQGQDPKAWNASYGDQRFSHAVAIDPGFVWGLEAENVADLKAQTLMIGFGGEGTQMMDTDFNRSGLSGLLPEARIEQFNPAFHFTAMPLCKPAGEAILIAENDDPVCTDPDGTDRAAVHAAIVDMMAEELGL